MNPDQLSTDELAERCAEENAKRTKDRLNATGFCFALLRRALVNYDQLAWLHVYRIYENLVRRWVYQEQQFEKTDESSDFFISWGFAKFFKGIPPERFTKFATTGHLLRYLKLCAQTAVRQYFRDHCKKIEVELSPEMPDASPQMDNLLISRDLWDQVCRIVHNANERLLLGLYFSEGLKPAAISALYPDRWSSAQHVSTMLFRVMKRLRTDPTLQQWAESVRRSNEDNS